MMRLPYGKLDELLIRQRLQPRDNSHLQEHGKLPFILRRKD